MELYAYATELFAKKRVDPHDDLMSVLTTRRARGRAALSELELELFFLLLTVAGNETTRNLIVRGMHAFFEHPDQWQRLRARSVAAPRRRRGDAALRHTGDELPPHGHDRAGASIGGARSRRATRSCSSTCSANRDEAVFDDPDALRRRPQSQPPHRLRRRRAALLPRGEPGPHGDPGHVRAPTRPDARHPSQTAEAQRLQRNFINGVKHLPVAFSAVGGPQHPLTVARHSPDALRKVIRDFRRDQIVDVARRLFGEHRSTEVSMDEIAAEAGLARSTVYVYFASRDDLLRACLDGMYEQMQERLAPDLRAESAPPAALASRRPGAARAGRRAPRVLPAGPGHPSHTRQHRGRGRRRALPDRVQRGQDLRRPGGRGRRGRGLPPPRPGPRDLLIGQQVLRCPLGPIDRPRSPLDVAADEICSFVLHGIGARA